VKFSEYYEQKKGVGKIALRRAQMRTAIGDGSNPGNPTMQIWLGKNLLGQVDSHKIDTNISGTITLAEKRLIEYMTEEDIDAIREQIEDEEVE
jgi:hypothetical protein